MSLNSRSKRNGFTLIEILVVISIIAFLVVSAAGVLSALSGSQISVSKNNIVSVLDTARRLAVKEHKQTAVLFMKDAQSGEYYSKTLIAVEEYTRTISEDESAYKTSSPEIVKFLPRFIEADGFGDQRFGEGIEIRAQVVSGTKTYWQTPDDFYDGTVNYVNNTAPKPLYLAIVFDADGRLYEGDASGDSRGVFLADGDPRQLATEAIEFKRSIVFSSYDRLVIYSTKDVERVYEGEDLGDFSGYAMKIVSA